MRLRNVGFCLAVVLFAIVPFVTAGAPLVCFPYDIGGARSLPWTADGGIGQPRNDYDTGRLAADTLALLGGKTPVIVRMETIRRAALYARVDDAAGQQLLAQLKARLQAANGNDRALALFDYGYLVETLKQAVSRNTQSGTIAAAVQGYGYICQALKARGDDPEMEFAAAKVSAWPRLQSYQTHLQRAVAGAQNDPLLATNLRLQFPSVAITADVTDKRAETARRK